MRHDGRAMPPARHSRPIRFLWALLAVFLCTARRAWADAEDPFAEDAFESRGDTQRWVPSLVFFAAVAFHKFEAKLDGTLRGPVDGEDLNSHMRVLGLEIMTPRLFEGFGDPRLFFRAGAGRSWDTRHNSAKEGNPGPTSIRVLPGGLQPPLLGQGSATRVQWSFGWGLGVRPRWLPN